MDIAAVTFCVRTEVPEVRVPWKERAVAVDIFNCDSDETEIQKEK
jgi:hypothetical protein